MKKGGGLLMFFFMSSEGFMRVYECFKGSVEGRWGAGAG